MDDDDDAIRAVYDISYRRLVTQMVALCGNRAEAEDVVQETFLTALTHRRDFTQAASKEAWLRTVALNVIRRRWRRARMFRLLSPKLATPADVPGISEDHLAVVEAMRAVPLQQRETLALFYLAGLSVQEIAATLKVADGTVKSRLNRGRTALAEQLRSTVEADRG